MPDSPDVLLARIDERTENMSVNLSRIVGQITEHAGRIREIETTCAGRHGAKGDTGAQGSQGVQGVQGTQGNQGLATSRGILALVSGGNTALFLVIIILLKRYGIL